MRLALALSLALHAVVLQQIPYSSAMTRHDAPGVVLTVQLPPAAATPAAASSDPAHLPAADALPLEVQETGALRREHGLENREGSADVMPSRPASRGQSPAPLIVAPTYYGLRDVDVFPRPIDPLPMPRAESADGAAGRRMLRVEVFIDERGVVTDVQLRETRVSARLRRVTTEMFFATRFQPARKSGHAVASRIEIELLYGGPQMTAN
jgi:hypothetical protein